MEDVELAPNSFRPARPGSEGYDKDEVDRFVAEVKAALLHTPPTMAPWEVRDKVFHTQRVHRGYDEHDVDEFLDQAEQALREAHGELLPDPHEDVAPGSSHPLVRLLVLAVLVVAMVAVVVAAVLLLA